ncbi:MAG: TldD/PmbA family protein [Candidatus Coatesbacteria bacterium]
MTRTQAFGIIRKVLKIAKADAVSAGVRADTNASTRIADNAITQNVRTESQGLWVEVAYGKRSGGASTNDLGDASLRAVVARAQQIAKVTPPDPEYMPPLPGAEAKRYPVVSAFVPATLAQTPMDRARVLASAAAGVRRRRLRLSGAWSTSGTWSAFGNSKGLRAWHRLTYAEAHMTVLGPAGSGWAQAISTDAGEVDVAAVVAEAAGIAVRAQHAVDLPAGKYDVIMRPAAVADILGFVLWGGFDAKATDERRTFLRGKLGRKVFGDNINLRTDPGDPRCPGWPFHGDGLAAKPRFWIRNGVVENLIYSRYWAKKKRKAPTGWPTNTILDGQGTSVDDMIASTKRGLLITRFWYIRDVDPMAPTVTGMTRDGLFLVENGRIVKPVKQMRFNENLVGVFSRVEALGVPVVSGEWGGMVVPPLKVRDFTFTSTTRFG